MNCTIIRYKVCAYLYSIEDELFRVQTYSIAAAGLSLHFVFWPECKNSILRRYPCTVVGELSDIPVTSCPDKNAGTQDVRLYQYVNYRTI